MEISDLYLLGILQILLVLYTAYVAIRDKSIRKREMNGMAKLEIERGDKSMAGLYTVYGAAIASFLVLIDKASGVDGHKVAFIVIDFCCVTYLFFFSTWFRNSVFIPLATRIRKD